MEIGDAPANAVEQMMRGCRLQLLVARRMVLGPEWHLNLCSPFWRVYVNDRAGAHIVFDGQKLALQPDAVWLIPAWVRFQTGRSRSVTQDFVHFQLSGLPPGLLKTRFCRPIRLPRNESLDLLRAQWTETGEFPGLFWAAALVHGSLACALGDWSEQDQRDHMRWLARSSDIAPALECIERQLALPPLNRELARLCGAGEDHFIRKFRAIMGTTPARHGLDRRLEVAAEWLTSTDRTLDDISEATGFTDRFHFSRVFKSRLGLPPASYRRMHRREN